ncbi:unnamed protein product [Clonostachys rosea]|uniref:Beta-galactosidase n=1 Tax=Bionectria ochroleuca TaxID=29856 RepID=A0ABY6UXQ4_BIOOC|nr:unnamed protein product [Clonostachys rosea]
MKLLSVTVQLLLASASWSQRTSLRRHTVGAVTSEEEHEYSSKRDLLQDIVTWDDKSLFIHGERLMLYAAEMHPFRMPVPSMWLDIMQKVRALGFNSLSFYVDWALLEGKPGEFSAEGVFSLEAFFDAALEAGIWLIARPGPYINAEVSGGGFPGWLNRLNGTLRFNDEAYIEATNNYANHVNKLIADAQITNGGPVILYQPENEYFYRNRRTNPDPPDPEYIARIIQQVREAGIIVPLHSNDGDEADISRVLHHGAEEVDMIGYDAYPLGFDCFQGGAFSRWGGAGPWECVAKFNQEFERVFYKDLYSLGFSIISIYMTYGGTNWGNLGMPGGPTTYDYGAAIGEDRLINREKYSELKLQAQLFKVAPGYLTSSLDSSGANYSSTSSVSIVARLNDDPEDGNFFVARQTKYWDTTSVNYTLLIPTSMGVLAVPQLGGVLSLIGRDSKVHVSDFSVGDTNLLYSTAEIFTWKEFETHKVLVLYGAQGELHEFAVEGSAQNTTVVEGVGVTIEDKNGYAVIQYHPSPERRVVKVGNLQIYLLDRNSAYNYWVTDIPGKEHGKLPRNYGTSVINPQSLIIKGPYLSRFVEIVEKTVVLSADFNATSSSLEIIGVPTLANKLVLNGREQSFNRSDLGTWVVEHVSDVPTTKPVLPDLRHIEWYKIDSLPEIVLDYDNSLWTKADLETTYNTWNFTKQTTPTSLFASDYGYHTGSLVYIGAFNSTGGETSLTITTSGGRAFASATWLDGEYLGSYSADATSRLHKDKFNMTTPLVQGTAHSIVVIIDHMGLESNWVAGNDSMKEVRGILDWSLEHANSSSSQTHIDWTLTGNLGGEDYRDKARGPLNEGGFFAERQGFHLPQPPLDRFQAESPFDGVDRPGVAFYSAKFSLDISSQHDVPLYVVFDEPDSSLKFRAVIYINGWQFGKYVNDLGPQTYFPVPEGILDYKGENWIGIVLIALDEAGAAVNIRLESALPILTGMTPVELVESPVWKERPGAY